MREEEKRMRKEESERKKEKRKRKKEGDEEKDFTELVSTRKCTFEWWEKIRKKMRKKKEKIA